MTNTKFTPGPWLVEGFYYRAQRFRVKSTPIGPNTNFNRTICAMGSPRAGRTKEFNPFINIDQEDEANANLIAAAPALYEALESAMFDLEQEAEQRETCGNDEFSQGLRAAIATGAGALKAARGES